MMPVMDYQTYLGFARQLAAVALRIGSSLYHDAQVALKSDGSHVTEADTSIQAALCERIRLAYPDHAVVCEEAGDYLSAMPPASAARYCWVIDPLDGTRNYARRLPSFCTSIALLDQGEPVVAVIADQVRGVFYTSVKGAGAYCDVSQLAVATPSGHRPVVSFQPATGGSTYDDVTAWIRDIHLRSYGSTALHLAFVAEGGLDGAFCIEDRIWDLAAGVLLVTEAGGVVTDLSGRPVTPFDMTGDFQQFTPFIAGEKTVHRLLLAGLDK